MRSNFFETHKLLLYISLIVFFWFLYSFFTFFCISDFTDHAYFVRETIKGKIMMPGNFIVYSLTMLLSFFSTTPTYIKLALTFLVALATLLKLHIIKENISKINWANNWRGYLKNILLSITLLVVFVLYVPIQNSIYIGKFVPNVWHNSTTIFLFPFAILLFIKSCQQLNSFNARRNIFILLYVFLNIFIKPSFFFVWMIGYPVFLFIRYKFSQKEFWLSMVPVVLGTVFLLIQYWYIYKFSSLDSSVDVDLFGSYRMIIPNAGWKVILVNFMTSFLFPLLYFVFNTKKVLDDKSFLMMYLFLFLSLLIYFLFVEKGPRATHGNFYWQVVICTWLCYYKSFLGLLEDTLKNKKRWLVNKMLMIVYSLHVFSGVLYLLRYIFTKQYF